MLFQKSHVHFTKATRPFHESHASVFQNMHARFFKSRAPAPRHANVHKQKNPRSLSEENATRKHPSGRWRIRTADPLLVRQML